MNIVALWTKIAELWRDLIDPPFRIRYYDDDPEPTQLGRREFAIVGTAELRKYAHFLCPCNCHDIIVLTSNAKVRPRWTFHTDLENRPTVMPSVWRTKGCRSHFLIKRGRIVWVTEHSDNAKALC
jgi:hypothetical protein